jgi:hypothetical protein
MEKTFTVYLLLVYIIIVIHVHNVFNNVTALFIYDIKDFYHASKDFRRSYLSWILLF